ncbi:hypothetical protein KA183_13070 [bacterium]|nr:hypothetical protein [bacterium]QQR57761.1 MAG: hypothetical protein IPG59_22780 [Candidatus Melainabacteria bacterium]
MFPETEELIRLFERLNPEQFILRPEEILELLDLPRNLWLQDLRRPVTSLVEQLDCHKEKFPALLVFSPAELLFSCGIALTPADSTNQKKTQYLTYSYGHFFQGNTSELLLSRDILKWLVGERQKMAEHLSVGVAWFFMARHLRMLHICDFNSAVNQNFVNKVGKKKRPDYCGLRNRRLDFLEVKGGINKRQDLPKKIEEGKLQFEAVKSLKLNAGGNFVIATDFEVEGGSNSNTLTQIWDPDNINDEIENIDDLDDFIRLSYAKVFRYAGSDFLANYLIQNKQLPHDFYRFTQQVQGPFKPIGFNPFGGFIYLHERVLQILWRREVRDIDKQIRNYKFEKTDDNFIVLPNGAAIYGKRKS